MMQSAVILARVHPDTTARLRKSAGALEDAVFEETADAIQTLAHLRETGAAVDAVVLGENVEDPVRVAQKVRALDQNLGLLILSEPAEYQQLARAIQFAPFLSGDIVCRPSSDQERLVAVLDQAVSAARQRRRHHATVSALHARLAAAPPLHQNVAYSLDRLLDVAPVAIVVVDREGVILTWNPRAAQVFELEERAALGSLFASLFPRSTRGRLKDLMARGARRDDVSAPFVVDRRTREGETQFVEVITAGLRGLAGQEQILCLAQDVTARVAAERDRERARQQLAFIAEASAVLAASLDYQDTLNRVAGLTVPALADWCAIYTVVASGALRQVVSEPGERPGINAEQPARDEVPPIVQRVFESGVMEIRRAVGGDLVVEWPLAHTILPLFLQDRPLSLLAVPLVTRGWVLGVLLMAVDEARYVGESSGLAEELARRAAQAVDNARLYRESQEAVQLRDDFLSIASHELKTPITALMGYAELLGRRAEREAAPERDRRAIHAIYTQTLRLTRLVDSMLDLSRIQLGTLAIETAPVELCQLVRQQVEMVRPLLERHVIEVECSSESLLVAGDELRLEQVFYNLLDNAIKYSPAGGVVNVNVRRQADTVCVDVSDQGVGIPPTAQKNLFTRFYRAGNVSSHQISGFGLGLYVVKQIVELHGGAVSVESREGAGSVFTVCLPEL